MFRPCSMPEDLLLLLLLLLFSSPMDHPKLSLGPSLPSSKADSTNSSSSESEANNGRKRKLVSSWEQTRAQASIDLQLNNPLPVDWEQCLDIQSGRMYCINRNTMKKSWVKPKEKKKLDLDLNISNLPEPESGQLSSVTAEELQKQAGTGSDTSMVAIVCLNCYLLVMLCRSSPSCPNCKYMHSLHPSQEPPKVRPVKTLETLSLLH